MFGLFSKFLEDDLFPMAACPLQSTAQVVFHSVPQEGLLISSMAASADGGQKTGETEVGKAS